MLEKLFCALDVLLGIVAQPYILVPGRVADNKLPRLCDSGADPPLPNFDPLLKNGASTFDEFRKLILRLLFGFLLVRRLLFGKLRVYICHLWVLILHHDGKIVENLVENVQLLLIRYWHHNCEELVR